MCGDPINRSGGTEHRNLPSPGRLTVYTEVIHVDVKPAIVRNGDFADISAVDLWIVRLNHRQEPRAGQKERLW
jgi:hypothetical protein